MRSREQVLKEFDIYPDGKLVDAMADRIRQLEALFEDSCLSFDDLQEFVEVDDAES
jgi:hypothetical protein